MKIFILFLIGQLVQGIKIFSSAVGTTLCENEALYGTASYVATIERFREQIADVENGYPNLDMYLVMPLHIGCQLVELEIIAVETESSEMTTQNFEDLTNDIKVNVEDDLEIKIIAVDHLNRIPPSIQARMACVRCHINAWSLRETEIRTTLNLIAQELNLHITNVRIFPQEIHVRIATLGINRHPYTARDRMIHNRFILMARRMTRRIVRIV